MTRSPENGSISKTPSSFPDRISYMTYSMVAAASETILFPAGIPSLKLKTSDGSGYTGGPSGGKTFTRTVDVSFLLLSFSSEASIVRVKLSLPAEAIDVLPPRVISPLALLMEKTSFSLPCVMLKKIKELTPLSRSVAEV